MFFVVLEVNIKANVVSVGPGQLVICSLTWLKPPEIETIVAGPFSTLDTLDSFLSIEH